MSATFVNCGVLVRDPEYQVVTVQNQSRRLCNLKVCFDSPEPGASLYSLDHIKKKMLFLSVSFWDNWASYARDHLCAGVRLLIEGELTQTKDFDGAEYIHLKGRRFSIDASMIKRIVYDEARHELKPIELGDSS